MATMDASHSDVVFNDSLLFSTVSTCLAYLSTSNIKSSCWLIAAKSVPRLGI